MAYEDPLPCQIAHRPAEMRDHCTIRDNFYRIEQLYTYILFLPLRVSMANLPEDHFLTLPDLLVLDLTLLLLFGLAAALTLSHFPVFFFNPFLAFR